MANNSNKGCLILLLLLLLCPWLVVLVPVMIGLLMGMFGLGFGLLGTGIGIVAMIPAILGMYLPAGWTTLLTISLLVAIILPIIFLLVLLVRLVRGNGFPSLTAILLAILLWLLSIGGVVVSTFKAVHEAGGAEALQEQLSNQSQVWEYKWSNVDDNFDFDNSDSESEN